MEVAVFVLCALHILSIQLQELPKILLHNGKAPVCGLPAEMEKKKDMKIQTEIAAVLLAAAVAVLLLYRRHKRRQYPYRQKFLLTKTEYAILKFLMEHPNTVYAPKDIYRAVWEDAPFGQEGTVAVHIRHLREKIEADPSEPRYIKVVWGQGYMFGKE